ncbi:class F sortase [Streptomyces sp. NBC_00121]|uniref:class F sortase n=1 Tax=unclassified Streptomyces TaxID=2593676 RepID=UPI002DDAD1FE|nr:class F sortase [Streptomyces sp. NBC_01760]WSC68036.1 class F sortase [Streptomyces sp. NBC_01760]
MLTAAALTLVCGCTPTAPAPKASSSSAAFSTPPGTTSAAPPAAGRAMARSLPERLRIPLIGVDTAVMPLGLLADGEVAVPPIAAHAPAGWYDGSPTPGQTGPSVILGHVTVGRYGDGVFKQLPRLRAGDRVSVTRMDGSVATFAVDSVQTVAKTRFPTQRVYGNVDHPALRLITCGGTRVGAAGGYSDNVIVYASLVAAS